MQVVLFFVFIITASYIVNGWFYVTQKLLPAALGTDNLETKNEREMLRKKLDDFTTNRGATPGPRR